jgi:DNA-binding NtrC family response regulator
MAMERRVLLVDENASTRSTLAAAFRQHSLITDEAATVAKAVELLGRHRYSVVLIDATLAPDEELAIAEAIPEAAESPVVLVATTGGRCYQPVAPERVHGILRKPFDSDEVAEVVAACADVRMSSVLETMTAALISSASLMGLLDL